MPIRIDGTNTTANPGITGGDADTGLQFGTDEISFVTGGTEKVKIDNGALKVTGQSSGITDGGLTLDWESVSQSARFFAESAAASQLKFFTTNSSGVRSEQMRINDEGYVTMPNVPAFQAVRSGIHTQPGNDAFVPYNAVRFNNGNHYDTTSFRFTAPVAGIYFFTANVYRSANNFGSCRLFKNNSTHYSFTEYEAFDNNAHFYTCATIDLSAGDTVNVTANNYLADSNSFFGGQLIG